MRCAGEKAGRLAGRHVKTHPIGTTLATACKGYAEANPADMTDKQKRAAGSGGGLNLDGGHHSGGRDFIILVHQQLNGAVLINAEQLGHALVQHWQQLVFLDEIEDSRLLLPEVDGQGQVIAALDLVQLGCHLKKSLSVPSRRSDPDSSQSKKARWVQEGTNSRIMV